MSICNLGGAGAAGRQGERKSWFCIGCWGLFWVLGISLVGECIFVVDDEISGKPGWWVKF